MTTQHTPESFTVGVRRQIICDGKPCIAIQNKGCTPIQADDLTRKIAYLLNMEGELSVTYEQKIEAILAENERLREALKPINHLCNVVLSKRDGSHTVSLAECLADDDTFAVRLTLAQANAVHNALATAPRYSHDTRTKSGSG